MTATFEHAADLGRPLTTDVVARLVGASYRQIDYWVRLGVLTPSAASRGSGVPRGWAAEDLRAAHVVAQLRRLGASVEACRVAVRRLDDPDLPAFDAGWLVVAPLGHLFADVVADVVPELDALELLARGGAWVLPVPDLVG